MTRVTAIVPCKDGEDSIADTVAALKRETRISDIVVVDDGSTDDTAVVAAQAGAKVIRLAFNRGKGAAMRAGIEATPGAEVYVFVDADTSSTAGGVAPLIDTVVKDECDLSIGVLPAAGKRGGFGSVKRVAIDGIRRSCGLTTRAPLSGQRAAKADVIRKLRIADKFQVEVAMTIDAARIGARVKEIDVVMDHKHRGRSAAGFLHRGKQGIDVVKALWPRLLPRSLRLLLTLLLVAGVFVGLVTAHGTGKPSGQQLPKVEQVQVNLVPAWLWPDDGSVRTAAAGSVVTGDVDDIIRVVRAGSRDPEAQPVNDVDVQVETRESILNRDPTLSLPGTLVITAGFTDDENDPALRPLIVAAPGVSGTLVSSSTHRSGLADITDIAPTVLAALGKEIPDSVDGAPLEFDASEVADVSRLANENEVAKRDANRQAPIIATYVVLQFAVFVAALFVRVRHQDLERFTRPALAVATFPLACYLMTWATAGRDMSLLTWSALCLAAIGIIVAMSLAGDSRNRGLIALRRISLITAGTIVVDLLLGGTLQHSGVFGSSPLLGTRYFGLGNPATVILLLATVTWASLHVQSSPNERRARIDVAAMFAVVVLAIGLPNLGADAGGLLAGVLTALVAVALLGGVRLTRLRIALIALAGAALTGAVAILDSMRSADAQTHLGRLIDRPDLGTTIVDRLETNLLGYGFPWTLSVVVLAAVYSMGIARWFPARSAPRTGAVAAMVAAWSIYLLNDSGIVSLALAAIFVGPFTILQSVAATNNKAIDARLATSLEGSSA